MIVNCTPHKVVVFGSESVEYDAKNRKYFINEVMPVILLIAEPTILLNAESVEVEAEVNGIPVWEVTYPKVDDLPESIVTEEGLEIPCDENTYYIVSALYATARKNLGLDCSRLLTIHNPVYKIKEDGAVSYPLGCLGFRKN